MRKEFKKTVMDLASQDDRIVVILGDVSVYLFQDFKERHPGRFYNMGIAENTLISVGAGLSSLGFHPFVHTIAPFITERSFEQIKLDMCYNASEEMSSPAAPPSIMPGTEQHTTPTPTWRS